MKVIRYGFFPYTMRREELYIGGEWVRPHGEGEIQVINPTTEDIIGSVPVGNSDDINHAVSAARSAFVDPVC